MSNDQHSWDLKNLPGKHFSEGGKGCLNRHESNYKEGEKCSHRWQSYKAATADAKLYNWPAYQSLSNETRKNRFSMETYWFQRFLTQPPAAGAWDLDKNTRGYPNFRWRASIPYWHEAHHIVPNSDLCNAILKVGQALPLSGPITLLVRSGLLDEGYNLNDQINMILLPMDRKISRALGLPRHRSTRFLRNHKAYSKNVSRRLDTIFRPLKENSQECKDKLPKYKKCRKQIEDLSKELYPQIVKAGDAMKAAGKSDSLDDMPESAFREKPDFDLNDIDV